MSEREDNAGPRSDGQSDGGRDGDDQPVPKLPRGRGLALSWPQLTRIGLTVVTLVALVALQKPCSESVGRFVTTFGEQPKDGKAATPGTAATPTAATPTAATPTAATPGTATPPAATSEPAVGAAKPAAGATSEPARAAAGGTPTASGEPEPQYELMSTSMTDAELRAAFERAKRRAEAAKAAAATRDAAAAAGSAATPANPTSPPTPANPTTLASPPAPAPLSPPKER